MEREYGKRCNHQQVTLVQHMDDEFGWFAAYQCDNCGVITQAEVTAEDLDTANNAPWLDVAMYEESVVRAVNRTVGTNKGMTLAFFGKATR